MSIVRRISLGIAGCTLIGCLLACAGPVRTKSKSPDGPQIVTQTAVNQPATKECKIGDAFRHGDLSLTVTKAYSAQAGGLYYGGFRGARFTMVTLSLKNNSPGKIIEWRGCQGKGQLEDEFANKFEPSDLSGWQNLPWNSPEEPHPDNGRRINPGETIETLVYYQHMPLTSKQVTITLPLDTLTLRVKGKVTHEKQ